MFCAGSALAATYYFDFTLIISMVCDHVTFDIVYMIGVEVTLVALVAFLVEMYSICVICHRLDPVSFKFTDFANNYF